MSDGDFRRPPLLWEQRLAQKVDVTTVGLGVSAAYEVSNEPPPGEGGPGTDPPVETPRPDDFSKPSTPTLTGAVQGIRAVWNGLTASGNPFPIETAWIEVHLSTAGTGFTPGTATLKGQLYDPGEIFLGGLTAGTTYFVKFRGADAAGSVTEASDAASGQTGLTTAGDYGTATIGSGAVSFNARTIGGVTNTVGSVAPTSPLNGDVWLDTSPGTAVIHKIYSGGSWTTNAWGSASIAAGQITALQIAAGAITAGAIAANAVTAAKIDADAINGKTIVGATIKTAGTVGTSGFPGVVIDTSGLKAYNSTGGTTVDISAATGNVTISGYLTQADVGSGGSTNIDGGRITTGTISANRLDLSGVLTATSVGSGGTTQIDGGRITTGTISANRLDLTGRLTATDVGSSGSTVIDGGRITSGTITGRTIRTSGGGSRIVVADGGADTIGFYSSGTVVATVKADPNQFVFDVSSGSEVKVSGKLQVNSTSNFDGAINVNANGTFSGDLTVGDELFADRISTEADLIALNGYRTTSTGADTVLRLRSNAVTTAGTIFQVEADGDVKSQSNSYAGFSDERYKSNITPARQYLADLCQVQVVTYNWTGNDYKMLGVIAQQVQPIFPNMVSEDPETGMLSVRYSVFVPMLITAVQELSQKVDDLTARIEALEG